MSETERALRICQEECYALESENSALKVELAQTEGTALTQQILINGLMEELAALRSASEPVARQYSACGVLSDGEQLRQNLQPAQSDKDAERYRWLRHGDNDEKVIKFSIECRCGFDDVWMLRNEELDAAIDQAMQERKVSQYVLKA